nr:MAG TPA: hypothetical protein [Caudoviricetes sp.]
MKKGISKIKLFNQQLNDNTILLICQHFFLKKMIFFD